MKFPFKITAGTLRRNGRALRGRVSNSLVLDLTLGKNWSYGKEHANNGKERITCNNYFDVSKRELGASAVRP